VQGLVINKKGAESGLPVCAAKTSLPILQDDAGGNLWAGLGAPYNGLIVVGPDGIVADQLFPGSLPANAPDIEAAIGALLE
jgi:hypothetical protein